MQVIERYADRRLWDCSISAMEFGFGASCIGEAGRGESHFGPECHSRRVARRTFPLVAAVPSSGPCVADYSTVARAGESKTSLYLHC